MFKNGDKVVMHSCMEAKFKKYIGKIWDCDGDSFIRGGEKVFLKGFSGSFGCKYLQKVNVDDFLKPYKELLINCMEEMEITAEDNEFLINTKGLKEEISNIKKFLKDK